MGKHMSKMVARLAALPIVREPEVRPALWCEAEVEARRVAAHLRALEAQQRLARLDRALDFI